MKLIRTLKRCEQRSRRSQSNVVICMAAIVILFFGGLAEAGTSADGLSVQASGMKINLQLAAPGGAKLVFQRASNPR